MKKCPPPRTWPLASSASSFAINKAAPPSLFLAAAAILCAFARDNENDESNVRPTTASATIRSNNARSMINNDTDNKSAAPPPVVLARLRHRTTTNATPAILATSDAAAERFASEAAFRRIHSSSTKRHNTENGLSHESTTSQPNNDQSDQSPTEPHPQSSSLPLQEDDDSYPTFTPYHNSLLKKYLTPHLWSRLAPPLSTSYHTTIEDMIRPGVALPLGAHPPRRVGILAGDAECYTVFQELMYPIVSEYHGCSLEEQDWEDPELPNAGYFERGRRGGVGVGGVREDDEGEDESAGSGIMKSGKEEDYLDDDEEEEENDRLFTSASVPATKAQCTDGAGGGVVQQQQQKQQRPIHRPNLRRHSTIINNPLLVTSQQADPDNKYILSTRIRVARSLDGVRFPTTMSRAERRRVQGLIQECCHNFQSDRLSGGIYVPVLSMTANQNLDLIERHILFDNPNEWTIAAGLGRDWPDGRGLYANVSDLEHRTPDFMIWVNEEDHLRIMCLRKGGDIQGVFTTLMTGVRELERELRKRGWEFAFHPKLGYLTSCPTNVGTTMRASVHVRLEKLGQLPGFQDLVEKLKLEVRGKYGETDRQYMGIFDISNAERLGKSEVHLINVMVKGVAKLIELERRLERGEVVNCQEIIKEMETQCL
ncbi:hypothetical protein HJC23_011774 [Cyclotella cryptica]|uniref:Arginine kinase n=1 Tax=Cyclotella cryptica TaxID=29204 RepID=A0ABD3PJR9_9STRA|eukprot:CCRYP_014306-RA/>CCRYP_014306-RA protein AED:0.18 eAED:0.19 QI:0/-1/0/1/-1/1/1/0/652